MNYCQICIGIQNLQQIYLFYPTLFLSLEVFQMTPELCLLWLNQV